METVINIPLGGLANVPSEHDAPGGQLAAALNIINDDGAMRPIAPPTTVMQLDAGQRVAHVHKTADYTHFIVTTDDGGINWCGYPATAGGKPALTAIATLSELEDNPTEIRQVNSIGNTLVVLTDAGVQYFLWREADNAYKYLGNRMPEVRLEFALEGDFHYVTAIMRDGENIDGDGNISLPNHFSNDDWGTTNIQENTRVLKNSHVTPKLLESINSSATNNPDGGMFVYPFFVRYAYRLYDQTLTYHSALAMMTPSWGPCPVVEIRGTDFSDGQVLALRPYGMFPRCHLMTRVADFDLSALEDWSDIIKSVDVFISPQVWSWKSSDSNTYGNTFKEVDINAFSFDHFSTMRLTDEENAYLGDKAKGMNKYYQDWFLNEAISYARSDTLNGSTLHDYMPPGIGKWLLNLSYKSDEEMREEIENASSTLYLLKSYDIKKLKEMADAGKGWTKMHVPVGYLDDLATKEQMTDDFGSRDLLKPKGSFVYNGRLNIFDIEKEAEANALRLNALQPVTTGRNRFGVEAGQESTWPNVKVFDRSLSYRRVCQYVLMADGDILYDNAFDYTFGHPRWFFSPLTNIDNAAIYDYTNERYYDFTKDLTLHPFLNGTYWLPMSEIEWGDRPSWLPYDWRTTAMIGGVASSTERLPSAVWTSEVSNPFVFPAVGQITVGTGRVLGLGTATAALSEGQFGQFPLYAFTTDGVWALATGDDGQFVAAQPVSRDVCNNPSSITSLDNALAFTTDAGLMLLQGSQVTCISDVLRGTWAELSAGRLQGFDKLLEIGGFDAMALDGRSLGDYLGRCDVAFDYPRRRIIAYSALDPVTDGQSLPRRAALVYSLRSGKWGMMEHSWTGSINSYPEAYTMTTDHCLVDLAVPDTPATGIPVFIATRAIALSSPDVLKTVRTVALRGDVGRRDLGLAVYGSRDLHHWSYIGSTRSIIKSGLGGSPYRFFKVVAVGTMLPAASLTAMDIEFFERMGGRLR